MSKFGPFERMGTRETQRRAWREAVARAAEEWQKVATCPQHEPRRGLCRPSRGMTFIFARCGYYGLELCPGESVVAWETLLTKLAEPKPWTRPAKADLGKWIRRTACGRDPEPCSACRRWSRAGREKRRAIRDGQLRTGEALRRKRRAAQRRRR